MMRSRNEGVEPTAPQGAGGAAADPEWLAIASDRALARALLTSPDQWRPGAREAISAEALSRGLDTRREVLWSLAAKEQRPRALLRPVVFGLSFGLGFMPFLAFLRESTEVQLHVFNATEQAVELRGSLRSGQLAKQSHARFEETVSQPRYAWPERWLGEDPRGLEGGPEISWRPSAAAPWLKAQVHSTRASRAWLLCVGKSARFSVLEHELARSPEGWSLVRTRSLGRIRAPRGAVPLDAWATLRDLLPDGASIGFVGPWAELDSLPTRAQLDSGTGQGRLWSLRALAPRAGSRKEPAQAR